MGKGKTKLEALANRLVKTDACGNRDVQAVDFSGHGNIDKLVTPFTGDLSNAPALASEDKGGGLVEVNGIEHATTTISGPDDLNALILQFAQQNADVFNLEKGDFVGATAGDVADGMGDATGTFYRCEHCGYAGPGSRAQSAPQVVGILNTFQNQEQWFFGAIEQIKQIIFIFEMHDGGAL